MSKRADYTVEERGYRTPCWVWQLSGGSAGYGLTRRGTGSRTKNQAAHRWYYKQHVGDLPDDVDLHHLCEVRSCVNPDHLEPMTTAQHLRRHSSLSEDDVREIRRRHVPHKVTYAMLAAEFGTTHRNIKHIIAGTTWQEAKAA